MWLARLDMEHHYLPTLVVPIQYIYLHLHAFELLGWQELGQATGAHYVMWIRSYDCWSSVLAAQRLLWFNPQHHQLSLIALLKSLEVEAMPSLLNQNI